MYPPHLILPLLLPILLASSLVIHLSPPAHNPPTLHLQQPSNLTDRYYVECEAIRHPPQPGLTPTNRIAAIPIICDQLSQLNDTTIRTRIWHWVDEKPGNYQRAEGLPGREECERDIFGLMVHRCAFRSRFNVGSVNVAQLPEGDMPGVAMTPCYPRYVMAPQKL